MANTVIALKKSGTPSAVPGSLSNGEMAINYADGILFYKHANGSIATISGSGGGASSFGTVNAAGTLLLADIVNDVLDIRAGQNIIITGDAVNDRMTIDANLAPVFDRLNTAVTVSNTAPVSPSAEDLWWNSDIGAMFVYYNDGDSSQWVEIAGGGGGGSGGGGTTSLVRSTLYANTTSLVNDASQNITITGYKSYVLTSVAANNSAWVRVYTDTASRTADASRSIGIDPLSGSGVVAEVITSGNQSINITPFVVGGNLDNPVTSNVYVTVTNKSGSTVPININMTVIGLES